ncbi:MAG: DUF2461 domain-containing protein [Chitinophagales bacterium]|nr:DUF2461 domain-containing protein [Chitinophagales bacterium]
MSKIPQEAFDFLREIRVNNNREWFEKHKLTYKALATEVKQVFAEIADLLGQHDDIEKWRMYRIYRDLRFSKDKTPYKRYIAAEYMRRKPTLRGGYYIHIEPDDQSFIEVGFWNPNSSDLKRVRKEWETSSNEIRDILSDKELENHWDKIFGEILINAPSGFNNQHPDIDLINLKQWRFCHYFTDEEVLSEHFATQVDEYFQSIRPFFDYMSDILTTDLNGVSLI